MVAEPEPEEPLEGGNSSKGVVRRGSTVRKPWLSTTERTITYMRALSDRGVDVPIVHGRDAQGRFVLDFVPGTMAIDIAPLDLVLVGRVGALVRAIHEASADLAVPDDWGVLLPSDEPDLICHNDLATWNLVIDGDRLVFIDWDGAGPSTRLWDLSYAAIAFAHLFPHADISEAGARLRAFVRGYEADDALREALPAAMVQRAHAMHDLLLRSHEISREPWATMFVQGHGEHWAGTAQFIHDHEVHWHAALRDSPPTT